MAIARWVAKDGMDPKMGVLKPAVFDEVDCLLWAQMPFADDVRKYTFASIDHLVSKKGDVITEHPYIPAEDQLRAIDHFVDCMDLSDAGDKDEIGNRQPWFDTLLSYNPAIHRTKQASFHCAIVSDVVSNPLAPPHPDLLKYFDPPRRIAKRSRDAIEECKCILNVREVPKKVKKARQDDHEHAAADNDDVILLDRKASNAKLSQAHLTSESPAQPSLKPRKADISHDSETEDDEDEGLLLENVTKFKSPTLVPKGHGPLPTPARSISPEIDPGRAPGRIIGSTRPLVDFNKNLAQGDVVTKAVEDLGAVIRAIVSKPFTSRRTKELLECMEAMRDTSLKEDEVDAWNEFLRNLKVECLSRYGNEEFWSQVRTIGRTLSLISEYEAKKHGGISNISEQQAEEFIA